MRTPGGRLRLEGKGRRLFRLLKYIRLQFVSLVYPDYTRSPRGGRLRLEGRLQLRNRLVDYTRSPRSGRLRLEGALASVSCFAFT